MLLITLLFKVVLTLVGTKSGRIKMLIGGALRQTLVAMSLNRSG
jgi:hypothetical protein